MPQRSLWLALIVGTILNLINQVTRLLPGVAPIFAKLALTYSVPYLVSSYDAVSFRVNTARNAPVTSQQ